MVAARPYRPDCGGFPGYVSLTTVSNVMKRMQGRFEAHVCAPDETRFEDGSLIQHWHGKPPKVFHVEGIKPMPVSAQAVATVLTGEGAQ